MGNGRAKKGGEIAINGEFYKGGSFLPSTQLPKSGTVKKQNSKPKIPLQPWQIENIKRAIEGTKKLIDQAKAEGRQNAVEANEAYLKTLNKRLTDEA
jgi:hypothetical protein